MEKQFQKTLFLLRPQSQLGFREDLRAIIPLVRRGVGTAADVVYGERPGLVLQ